MGYIYLLKLYVDWTVYGVSKDHIESLCMMLEQCRQFQISLNMKKCILCAPFGILLGHVVFQDNILMNPSKIAIIVDLPPPTSVKQLRTTLGNTWYYWKIIMFYVYLSYLMENLLKKNVKFQWNEQCQKSVDILKYKMVSTPILAFPDWEK